MHFVIVNQAIIIHSLLFPSPFIVTTLQPCCLSITIMYISSKLNRNEKALLFAKNIVKRCKLRGNQMPHRSKTCRMDPKREQVTNHYPSYILLLQYIDLYCCLLLTFMLTSIDLSCPYLTLTSPSTTTTITGIQRRRQAERLEAIPQR
jgi:hypothetical protein